MFLRQKLIIILIILLSLGFSSTSIVSYIVSRHSLRNQIIANELPLTCDNVYSEIQRDLLPPVFISSLMANDAFLRNWVLNGEKDPTQIAQYLNEIKVKYKAVTSFFVSEKTKTYYHSGGVLKKVKPDEHRDVWYYRVREMKPDYEINVDPDMANHDTMTIFINYRVFDFKHNYIGATGVGLKISVVKALIQSYHQKYNRTIYFADTEGKIVLQSTDNASLTKLQEIPGLGNNWREIMSQKETAIEYRRDGQNIYLNSRYIPELNWILLVEQSDANAVANIFRTLVINLILCGLITITIIIITCVVIGRYQRRIEAMLRHEQQLNGINRTQKEKLAELNTAKDKLFSIIAHDLRNPIGGITQLLYLLDDAIANDDKQRVCELLGKLKTVSDSSFKLLESLSEWAASQSTHASQPEAFHLAPLLRECVDISRLTAERKQIEQQVSCPPELQVYADINMISTIIRNLLSNAVKFTRENGRIDVSATTENNQVKITIKDNGVGIPADKVDKLFSSIGNTSTPGTNGERGTGLGLSLCNDLIKLNHGTIAVESIEGQGSTFTVTLPTQAQN